MIPSIKSLKTRVLPLVVLALCSVLPVFGATITVTNNLDSGPGSLRQAIADANSGDTIDFSLTCPTTITLDSHVELVIDKNLTINGPGAPCLRINGYLGSTVFKINGSETTEVTVSISGLTIERGRSMFGGGIYNFFATLTLSNSMVWGNMAGSLDHGNGGGIFNHRGTLTLTNSTLWQNSAGDGGGIYNESGTVTLTNSTLFGNDAYNDGGGIFNHYGGTVTLTNSTLSGNSTDYASGHGGGIFNTATLRVKNTIIANSDLGGNCYQYPGTATSLGHNLSDDASCTFFNAALGDLTSTPAGLASYPGFNGGPTRTIALLPDSAAIDAIPVSPTDYCTEADGVTPIATDQRGVPRPQGAACDIGAFERGLNVSVEGPAEAKAVNEAVDINAEFTDDYSAALRTCTITWGDGYSSPGLITVPDTGASGQCTGSYLYPAAGVYTVEVTITNTGGYSGAGNFQFVVVYDPSAGFVTGGGIVNSPADADLANLSASGPATFGFVSKYLRGRSTPDGNLEFQFKAGDLNFKSTSMDWLVVTGVPRGQFQGTGTINGTTVCKFAVDAWDASSQPGSVDAFGLKIFACDGGGDRYNLPATPLTRGSIIIHRK